MRNTTKKATVRLSDIAKETGLFPFHRIQGAQRQSRRFRRDAANHQRGVETVWVFP